MGRTGCQATARRDTSAAAMLLTHTVMWHPCLTNNHTQQGWYTYDFTTSCHCVNLTCMGLTLKIVQWSGSTH